MPWIVLDPTAAQAAPTITAGAPKSNYGYTLGSMRTELALRMGSRTDIAATRYNQWINDAYRDLLSSVEIPEALASMQLDTVVDQPMYLLPEAVGAINLVGLPDTEDEGWGGYPLEKGTLEEYRRSAEQEGFPSMFFQQEGMAVLWPTPDEVWSLAVDFIINPTDLTADTHSPFVPKRWHEAILLLAKAKGHASLPGEADMALLAENDYIRWLGRRIDPMAEQDQHRHVGSAVPRTKRDLLRGRRRGLRDPRF